MDVGDITDADDATADSVAEKERMRLPPDDVRPILPIPLPAVIVMLLSRPLMAVESANSDRESPSPSLSSLSMSPRASLPALA
jgi:hypothetical protein